MELVAPKRAAGGVAGAITIRATRLRASTASSRMRRREVLLEVMSFSASFATATEVTIIGIG